MKGFLNISIGSTVASMALLGVLAPSARAVDFTPRETGEINVGLGCIDTCIDLGNIFESIVSLEDATTGHESRLFVDYFGEGDTTAVFENNSEKVVFETRDKGTNSAGFWFRPSEYNGPDGVAEEQGQLEVGTYQINFAQTMADLSIDFFDTESFPTTGVLEINGQAVDADWQFASSGSDGNIQTMTFQDVDSLVVKLGKDRPNGTGDGVNFRLSGTVAEPESVPEPTAMLGLLAVAGWAFKRKLS